MSVIQTKRVQPRGAGNADDRTDVTYSGMATPVHHESPTRLVVVTPDEIPFTTLKQKARLTSRTFTRNLGAALFLSFVTVGITVLQIFAWGWDYLLGFRIFAVIRAALLLVLTTSSCMCVTVKVHQLWGTGEPYQSFTALRALPLLLIWHLLGYIDLYIGRILPLILEFFRIPTTDDPIEVTLSRVGIDILLILIYFMEFYFVEARGIRINLTRNVLTVRKQVK